MKTLTLLRHAKSSWGDPAASDFDRPLNARGVEAARAMGRAIRRHGLAFDHVLASPAARTVQTVASLGNGEDAAAEYDCRLYLASVSTLVDIVRAGDDSRERLLVVGHNPGLAELALLFSRGGALRDQVAAKYPTGALAEIRFDAERWRDLAQGAGTLARFIRPRDLVPEG